MDNTTLNRAIAEQVMGLTVQERLCFYFHDSGQFEDYPHYDINHPDHSGKHKILPCIKVGNDCWDVLPDYSGNIAAAFIVVEQMSILDWAFTLNSTSSALGHEYLVWFTRLIKPSATGFAKESTPALTICTAALDALSYMDSSVWQSNSDETSGE